MGDLIVNDESILSPSSRVRIDEHRVLLVQGLDLDRHFILTYLRSNNIFDEEDCQLILNSGTTRQQKNSKFLDVLSTRGLEAFELFVQALEFELPTLYELFTGEKATTQIRVDVTNTKDAWAEFDREYLSKELVKLSGQNNSLAYLQEKLRKEKQLLEKKLLEVTSELNSSIKTQDELKFELSIRESCCIDKYDQETINNLMTHCQALVQENADKSNIIIALQARLLAVNEDGDKINKRVDELQLKNKSLMQQVKDLTINYDFHRTRSIKLQEKFDKRSNELNKSNEINREIHSFKFSLLKMTEERDEFSKKLDEYRNVVTALNAKLSLLTEQKEVEKEKWSEISEEYLRMRQQAKLCELERDKMKHTNEFYKEKFIRLEDELMLVREEKDFLTQELERTSADRDRAISEREDVITYNNDLLKSRDEAVRQQVDISNKLKKRYNDISTKLDTTNEELKDLMLENVRNTSNKDSQMKCEIFQTELENAKRKIERTKLQRQISMNEQVSQEENAKAAGTTREFKDALRTQSVLFQAKAILEGNTITSAADFSLNNRQLSWVYDSLKGKTSTFQTILNNPFIFPQFDTTEATISADTENEKSEQTTGEMKRRIGSNRGMNRPKRSNSAIEAVKAIISLPGSPSNTRRKSLTPFL